MSKDIEYKDPEATASWGSLSSANRWKLWAAILFLTSPPANTPLEDARLTSESF